MKKALVCLFSCFLILGCSHAQKEEIKKHKEKHIEKHIENDFTKSQILLLELHNKERTSKSLENLTIDKNLCDYAQKHAEKMANKNSLVHSQMSDLMKKSKGSMVGENIAWGQKTEQDVVDAWMWSPMHRWNILSKSYSRVGFGMAKDKNGSIYWCAVFSNKEV